MAALMDTVEDEWKRECAEDDYWEKKEGRCLSSSDEEPIVATKQKRKRRKPSPPAVVTHQEWGDDEYSDGEAHGVPPDTPGFRRIRQGGKRAKNWVFTAWEPFDFDTVWYRNVGLWKYMLAGEEVCPDTGTSHIQGYLQCERSVRRSVIQNLFQTGPETGIPNTRLATATAGWQSNYDYCRKIGKHLTKEKPQGNSYTEAGTPDKKAFREGQGHRTDVYEAYNMLVAGDAMVDVLHHNPPAWLKSHSGFSKMEALLRMERAPAQRDVKVIWIEGPTGIGKTHAVHALEADLHVQHMTHGFKYWDGYSNQEAVLIDEYSNSDKIGALLAYLDKWVVRINVKYSYRQSMWKRIYVVTNLPWDKIHPNAQREKRAALTRRIHERWVGWDTNMEEVQGQIEAGIAFQFFGDVVQLAPDQGEICGGRNGQFAFQEDD